MLRFSTAAAIALLLALPRSAPAAEYEVFIEIEGEQDLYDLLLDEQISEDTFNTLLELLQQGVDLNEASRELLYTLPNLTYAEVDAILTYRDEVGFIRDPAALVINRVLSSDKLGAIAPFLVIRQPSQTPLGASGWVRTQTRWTVNDDVAPPMALQARVDTAAKVKVGAAAVLTRTRLGDVVYDPSRDALTADPADPRPYLPKAYVHWDEDDFAAVAGTYRIGFGQRLTFDVTNQLEPNGFYGDDEITRDSALTRACKESAGELGASPCTGAAGSVYTTPDYRWRDSLMGVAFGLKNLEIDKDKGIQAYGFASYQPRSIYQYEIYDRGKCADPREDENPDCGAPDVFRTADDPFAPTSRFSFYTLPNMYAELIGGGNVTARLGRRAHVGVTGYGAYPDWLTEGIDLDFQEWSRTPFGGPFGAVGVNGAVGFGKQDFFAEVTRSFDSQVGGGGGFGALLRGVTSWGKNEVETSLRYYDQAFANPYARPISAPDEFDGLRARDEAGVRIRTTSRIQKKFSVRASADVWTAPSDDINEGVFYVRGDADVTRQVRAGLAALYQNKDFGRDDSMGSCFFISTEEDELGEPIDCGGEKYQGTGRVRVEPNRYINATVQYTHELVDDDDFMDADERFRQDVSFTGIVSAAPIPEARIRSRVRYLFEDIEDNSTLEQSVWVNVDASYRLRKRDRLRLRYDWVNFLDDRTSTLERQPSPEHWLWFEYQAWF